MTQRWADSLFQPTQWYPRLAVYDDLRGWGQGLFKVAHGLRIDRAGNIWTTDNGNHVIRKFSPGGKAVVPPDWRPIGETPPKR